MNTAYNRIYGHIPDLPLFNICNPRQWFHDVDRVFADSEIRGEMKRYYFSMHHLPVYLTGDEDLTKFLIPVGQPYTRLKTILLHEYEKSPTEYLLHAFPTSRILTSADTARRLNALRLRFRGDDASVLSTSSPSYFIGPSRWSMHCLVQVKPNDIPRSVLVLISCLFLTSFFYHNLCVILLCKCIPVEVCLWPNKIRESELHEDKMRDDLV